MLAGISQTLMRNGGGAWQTGSGAFTAELSAIGRNINQIAKRINAGGPTYRADIEEIRERLDQIWQLQRRILLSQR